MGCVESPVALSEEPVFRQKYPSIYDYLEEGKMGLKKIQATLRKYIPADAERIYCLFYLTSVISKSLDTILKVRVQQDGEDSLSPRCKARGLGRKSVRHPSDAKIHPRSLPWACQRIETISMIYNKLKLVGSEARNNGSAIILTPTENRRWFYRLISAFISTE